MEGFLEEAVMLFLYLLAQLDQNPPPLGLVSITSYISFLCY